MESRKDFQQALNEFKIGCDNMSLKFNVGKSKVLIFGNNQRSIDEKGSSGWEENGRKG